jgi:hypothetical protein
VHQVGDQTKVHLQCYWIKLYFVSCRWIMIIAVQIHVRMKLHVSTHKQTITAIVLRTGKARTVACLDCSVTALHVKVQLHDTLHSDRALECFISIVGLEKTCHRSQHHKHTLELYVSYFLKFLYLDE